MNDRKNVKKKNETIFLVLQVACCLKTDLLSVCLGLYD